MPNATNNQHLHVGDYGIFKNGCMEIPVYVRSMIPARDYFVAMDVDGTCHLVDTSEFERKGHLIEDVAEVSDKGIIDHQILNSGDILYTLYLDNEKHMTNDVEVVYNAIFSRMVQKLRKKDRDFHSIDSGLFNGYVCLTDDSVSNDQFSSYINYPVINGALFNNSDEVEYEQISCIEELNDWESDSGTNRQWQYVCSLEEGMKLAPNRVKHKTPPDDCPGTCNCNECMCGGCE